MQLSEVAPWLSEKYISALISEPGGSCTRAGFRHFSCHMVKAQQDRPAMAVEAPTERRPCLKSSPEREQVSRKAGCGTRGVNCTARNLRYGRIRNTDQKNRKPRRILCRNAQDSSGFFDRCIRLQGAPQIRYPGPDGGRWIWSRIRDRRCGH